MNHFVIAGSTFCIGCHTCEATCSKTHRRHGLQSISRLKVTLNEKESAPQLYHHYENILCAMVCPVNAVTRVDDAIQLDESLCVSCKLCGITYPFSAIEFSGGRPLDIPADANTPEAPPTPPAPVRVNTLLDWVSGIRTIAVKCSLRSFDEQGPTYVRMCPTKALHLVDNTDITRVSRRKRELTFNAGFGDLILFQQAQSGEAKQAQFP